MTRASSEGSFQVEKKTSKFPETMMGDKTTQKLQQLTIRFLNSRTKPNLRQIESPVQFLKSQWPIRAAILDKSAALFIRRH